MFKLTIKLNNQQPLCFYSKNKDFIFKIGKTYIKNNNVTRIDNDFPIETKSMYIDIFEEGVVIIRKLK